MNQHQNPNQMYNLHANGIGYLNRIRCVYPKRGEEYYCVTIAALHGGPGIAETSKTAIDCKVVGKEAIEVIKKLMAFNEAAKLRNEPKVIYFAAFTVGDLQTETYKYTKGDINETRAIIKARLLKLHFVNIGKDRYYTDSKLEQNELEQNELEQNEI